MADQVTCASCSHFRPPPPAVEGKPVLDFVSDRGVCQRAPTSIPKRTNEVCGEHPKFALLRDMQLAGLIADKLAQALAESEPPAKRKLMGGR